MRLKTVIAYECPPDAVPEQLVLAVQAALYEVVAFWHRTFLARHFTPGGAAIYRYENRTAKYLKEKERRFHHQDPLVFTGLTRTMVSGSIKITVKKNEAVGAMPAPRYLYQYVRSKPVKKYEELTRIAPAEAGVMARELQKHVVSRLNDLHQPVTVEIAA